MTEPIKTETSLPGVRKEDASVLLFTGSANRDNAKESLEDMSRKAPTDEIRNQIGHMIDLLNKHPNDWIVTTAVDKAGIATPQKKSEVMLVYDGDGLDTGMGVVVTEFGPCSVSLSHGATAKDIAGYDTAQELTENLNPKFVALRAMEIKRDKPEGMSLALAIPLNGEQETYVTKGGRVTNEFGNSIQIHLLDLNQDREFLSKVQV
ncbi:MAG: hypothetical protein NTV24_04985 [Candidatus Woesebacteria bacterium]|nr:hypothetical protein [Candidatus Woesebacteria bacterium]